MPAPAPYTRETVRDIRAWSRTQGLRAIAQTLGWETDRVKTVARRHEIEIAEDDSNKIQTPAHSNGTTVCMAAAPPVAKAEKEPRPIRHRQRKIAAVKDHPRTDYTTIALSTRAMEVLAEEKRHRGKSVAAIAGIVIDHVARNGKIPALLKAAFKEMGPT